MSTPLPESRRAEIASLLERRAALLVVPNELITQALARCLPRDGAPVHKSSGPLVPVPTKVATAPTMVDGVDDDYAPDPSVSAEQKIVTTPPSSPASAVHQSSEQRRAVETNDGSAMASDSQRRGSTSQLGANRHATSSRTFKRALSEGTLTPITVDGEGESPVTVLSQASELTPSALAQLSDPNASVVDTLKPDTIIAGYRIEAPLGAGAMGQVYRAIQLSMNRPVAFKILAPKLANNRKFRERFLREARSAGRLHHPNLIAVHDVGEADGRMFFSMELVDGTSVGELLHKHGRVPEMRALEIIRQALEALKFAHANGVVHRDIKPDNLMVTKSGMVKVADLGLARADDLDGADASLTATNTNAVMGTPHYMAPEQGRNAHNVDHRADLYSVGATLFHLVCGHPPFTGGSAMEVLVRSAKMPLKFPEPGPSPAIRTLISKLMEKEPGARPQSAGQVLEMITKLRKKKVIDDPESAGDAATAMARARARRMRKTMRKATYYALSISIAIVVILFFLGMFGSWQWHSTLNQAKVLAGERKYAEAIAFLNRQDSVWSSRQLELDRARSDINNEWNSWAYLQVQKPLNDFQKLMSENQISEAYLTLQSIPESLRSPKVQADIEDFQRQWESAMSKRLTAGTANQDEEQLRERWPQVFLDRLGFEFIKSFTYHPQENVAADSTTIQFSGQGKAETKAMPKIIEGRSLRLFVRIQEKNKADNELILSFGKSRRIICRRNGYTLEGNGIESVSVDKVTVSNIFIRSENNSVEIKLKDQTDWIRIASAAEPWSMSWSASGKRAIEVRVKVYPRGDVKGR